MAQEQKCVRLQFLETSDVHSAFYDYDFRSGKPQRHSLSRLSTYIRSQREKYGRNLILLDNGDILQGQSAVYYFNFIDRKGKHVVSRMMNYLGYDAANFGNHDIETGHDVFDRWANDLDCPVLGANIISNESGKPYAPPYRMFERDGVRIAVIGMLTQAIPQWLPQILWKNMRFEDITESMRYWASYVRKTENPDVVIALIHTGFSGGIMTKDGRQFENQAEEVSRLVPGIDVIFFGHDHMEHLSKRENPEGKPVYLLNPSNEARNIASVEMELSIKDGKVVDRKVDARLVPSRDMEVDEDFEKEFSGDKQNVLLYTDRKIGTLDRTISSRDCFAGPSEFMSLIHQLQLELTGAQISISAPLSMSAVIKAGDIRVGDMFNLYRFENYLYTMRLKGSEIRKELEMSYGLWLNQMRSADDNLFLLDEAKPGKEYRNFKNPCYNFDSAAGILYTVDVTKPAGERVSISALADGTPFDEDEYYDVAVNSYRGNGGGDLMILGAGITKEDLSSRVIRSTDKDLRYYLIKYVEKNKALHPFNLDNWKIVPEDWAKRAAERDLKLIFH